MPVLKVHSSPCDIEHMVHSEELRAAFVARLKKALAHANIAEWGAGVRLAKIAKATPKAASKWMNAESMPGRSNMQAIAEALGVRVEWLQYGEGEMVEMPPSPLADQAALTPGDDDDAYAHVRQKTARSSAGEGHENPHVEIRGTLAFKKSWLAYKGLKQKHLVVIYADGESMSPTISHGDVLLVDQSRREPVDGQVYVLNSATRGTIVKRLKRDDHGQWALISDNLDKRAYPDQWLADGDGNEMTISGRVVWRGGDM